MADTPTRGAGPFRGRGLRRRLGTAEAYVALTVYVFASMFPIGWIFLSSLKQPADIQTFPPTVVFTPTSYNYEAVLGFITPGERTGGVSGSGATTDRMRFPRALLNSVVIGLGTTVLALAFGSLAAYALARMRTRLRGAILTSILVTRLIPPIVILVPLYVIWRNLGLLDTHLTLMVTYLTFSLPFAIWMMRGFFMSVPAELEDAAQIDGCSRLGALVRVVLPLAAPGLAATGVFTMMTSWNEFLLATLLTGAATRTVPPVILSYISDDAILWGFLYAAASIVIVPVLVFSLFVQKYVATGLTGGAVKG